MDDVTPQSPDQTCLFGIATGQQGLFTSEQARACGFKTNLITYHTQNGRFIRLCRGVYRLRDYPSSNREEVVAAWLAVGKNSAVVSHESALDLLDLSDVIPQAVHLTVPRSKRYLPRLPGVRIHTTTRPLAKSDVTRHEGIRLTSATRTILDAAEAGTGPEQIELAIRQAMERGLTTSQRLEREASGRSRRVRDLVQQSLSEMSV